MRLLLVAIACLITFSLCAQKKYTYESYVGWRAGEVQLHTISSKDKRQHCLFVVGGDSLRALVVDAAMQPIKEWTIRHRPEERILGGFIHGDVIHLFSKKAFDKGLHSYSFNKASGQHWERMTPFDPDKEKFVDRLNAGDRFLWLTSVKKSSEIVVYDFSSDSTYTSFRYQFPGIDEEEVDGRHYFKKAIYAEKIITAGEPDLKSVQSADKIYIQGDSMYLLIDEVRKPTRAFIFDLLNKKVTERNFLHEVGTLPPKTNAAANSFLLGNNLFYVQVTFDSLWVEVSNIHSGAVIRQFRAGADSSIAFKNTPIIQEGGFLGGNSSRELERTKQLLRKMINGKPVVMAVKQNNRIVLTVASYSETSGGGGGAGQWVNSGAAGAPVFFPSGGGFARNGWTVSAGFPSLLEPGTFEHTKEEFRGSVNDWASIFADKEDMRVSRVGENLIESDGRYYYACYDKKEHRLVIAAF